MKSIITIILIGIISFSVIGQDKYITKTGHVRFHSKTILKEIEANSKQAASIFNSTTGEVIVTVPMRTFKFDAALLEEHFNENYVETHKYPKVKFKGTITNLNEIDFTKDGICTVTLEGDLTMHGETQHITVDGTAEVNAGKIIAKSFFHVRAEDYKIKIPELVKDKIQENIEVFVEFIYEPFIQK